jgi:hypothetical protein
MSTSLFVKKKRKKKKDVLLTDSHISLHGQVQQINPNI